MFFCVEAQANSPNLQQTVSLFNYVTGAFEIVSQTDTGFNNDLSLVIEPTGDSSRYIDSSGEIKSQIGWKANGFLLVFPWTISIDKTSWTIFD